MARTLTPHRPADLSDASGGRNPARMKNFVPSSRTGYDGVRPQSEGQRPGATVMQGETSCA